MPLGTTSRSFATIRCHQAAEVAVRRLASVPELLRAISLSGPFIAAGEAVVRQIPAADPHLTDISASSGQVGRTPGVAKPLAKPATVIAAPHWRPFRLDAEDALLEQRVEPDGIRAIDRWLVHLERQKAPVVTSGAVLSFFGDSTSPGPIARLLGALIAVRPTCPHIPAISKAHLLRQQAYQPAEPVRARSRTPKVSVERHELPADCLGAIAAMEAGIDRGCRAPAPSITATIVMKLRQLGFSAKEAGLPTAFTVPSLAAYVRAMIARGLAASTIASTLAKLETFAVYTGNPEETIAAITSERRYQERQARRAGKNKDRFLARSGLSIDDVARTALDCYQKALEETNPRIRHMDWMRGALFAFVICRALRPLDIFGLVVGRTLRRDSEGWALYGRASKNKYRLVGRLWDICTPYLDGAILLGADESQLWVAYARAEGRPLLAERTGRPLCENWATEQFRHFLGTGVGIMRTLGTTTAPRSAPRRRSGPRSPSGHLQEPEFCRLNGKATR